MFGVVLLVVSFGIILVDADAANICFEAKICVHNAVERCGEDAKEGVRRFLDSCDITEYNCLKKTDYQSTEMEKCKDLPPIAPEEPEN